MKEQSNLEAIKKKALEQFRLGKSLYGKDGAFAPMLKIFLEAALEGELDSHLDADERTGQPWRIFRFTLTDLSSIGAGERHSWQSIGSACLDLRALPCVPLGSASLSVCT